MTGTYFSLNDGCVCGVLRGGLWPHSMKRIENIPQVFRSERWDGSPIFRRLLIAYSQYHPYIISV